MLTGNASDRTCSANKANSSRSPFYATSHGYIRVSTAKQGRSGLGIEAQQEALQRFAEAEGYRFAATFTEVESGKHGEDLGSLG